MRVAVTTPQGHVGQHVTTMLIRAGIRPVLLARNPEKIPVEIAEFSEVRQADSTDVQQVVAATRDVDSIYWVDPSSMSANPLAEYVKATEALVAAAKANHVGRVVFQSSVGAEKRHGVGEIDGLAYTEVALGSLDIDVTILRCGYFFTNLLLDIEAVRAGQLATIMPLDQPHPWVAPRDIAEVAVHALLNPDWRGQRVRAVHGPADVTWNGLADILTEEVGHQVSVQRISDVEMRRRLFSVGMSELMVDAVMGMSVGLRDGFKPEQSRSIATTTPTKLAGWIRDELVPML